jgi:peptide/nickel transport system substrate-binding protein
MDKPDLPFKDLKVRQALNLAVDKQGYLKDYLKGQGVLLGYPYPPTTSYSKYFTPLDQLPDDAKMLFTGYNPDQAKKLLADAGYPNGFQTVIQGPAARADEMAVLQSYLSNIGVDMQIQPLDPGQYNSLGGSNNFDQMWYGNAIGVWAPDEMLTTKTCRDLRSSCTPPRTGGTIMRCALRAVVGMFRQPVRCRPRAN